ncbi:hypothetical protein [uncultured Microbacterium sp.]|uniref:hypothetical protein n=1 Tax=uncultured Microbacterium sp. TaxID=191216 RepID=UPI0028D3EA24|nr:hypothetical protein [uncultured Microbacterium sp.]
MSKGLITLIGVVVSIGVIALGFFLVALPIWLQSVAVDAQTQTVQSTNALYQSQVDTLGDQEENLDAINGEVAGLRAQIPASGQLDDVFEVIGRAAEASGASILSITAGETTAFVVRTGVEEDGVEAPPAVATPAPDASEAPEAGVPDDAIPPVAPAAGRQQVDFAITVTAPTMDQATAFLDALRAGPRLLSSITATASDNGEGGVALQVSALTFVDE